MPLNLNIPLVPAGVAGQGPYRRRHRPLAAAFIALLAGAAVTAFGVAPLAPDAADLPAQTLRSEESVASLAGQLEQLERHPLALYRSETWRASDTASSLLARLGIDDPEALGFLTQDAEGRALLAGRGGQQVKVLGDGGRLIELVVRGPAADAGRATTHFERRTMRRQAAGGFQVQREEAPLRAEVRMGSGMIESSLFTSADAAGLPDAVTVQLAELFGSDIDFRRDLRKGDLFSVLYEGLTADGEPVTWAQTTGRVLAARFINNGETHEAIWFQEPGQRGGYFDPQGRSKTRAYLGSPLEFSRVTSGFAMRTHPITGRWSRHMGVDYAAPSGTSVRAVGEGVVSFAGWQNGYGNLVILQHPGGHETRYAHLSRILVQRGAKVEQGRPIGAVGATGWATGPHLHFEFLVHGAQVDPIRMARASAPVTLSAGARAAFGQVAEAARLQLTVASHAADAPRFE